MDITTYLLKIVDERVEARLSELGLVANDGSYSSNKLPIGTSRRTFNEHCRSGRIESAVRSGTSPRNFVWSCSRSSWQAARGQQTAPMTNPGLAPVAPANDQSDEALLAAAGIRLSR